MTGLERLFLANNQLTIFPDALGKLAKLTELTLHRNWCLTIPTALWQFASVPEPCPSLRDHQLLMGQFRYLFELLLPVAGQNQWMLKQTSSLLKLGLGQQLRGMLRERRKVLQRALISLQQGPAAGEALLALRQFMGALLQQMLHQIRDGLQQADATTPQQDQTALHQWLVDTLELHQDVLHRMPVVTLQVQATHELVQLQECFKRVLRCPCLRVEAAPLAEPKEITLELKRAGRRPLRARRALVGPASTRAARGPV